MFVLASSFLYGCHLSYADVQGDIQKAEVEVINGNKEEAIKLLKNATLNHSGLAYSKLAELYSQDHPSIAINYYLLSAKFGYPKASYLKIAKLYQQGDNGLKKNDLLSKCYLNLSRDNPDQAMLSLCENQASNEFVYYHNLGVQTDFEIEDKARSVYKGFCQQANLGYLSNQLSTREKKAFQQLICNQNDNETASLKNGDLVIKGNQILKISNGLYTKYQLPLNKGEVVYRFINPKQVYYFDGKELKLATEGMALVKGNEKFVFHHNQFIKS